MLLVYTNKPSTRLEYIIELLAECVKANKFEITSDKNYFAT